MELTAAQLSSLKEVLKRHGVTGVKVFGSTARGQASEGSDLDLIATFPESMSLWDIMALKLELEALVKRRVDLVESAGLPPQMADRIRSEARAL